MRSRGFTLIELLIVVAIIAILAAIAVPNFLEAQTRSRVSRTENDLRTLDLAMESYRIDNGGYIMQGLDNKGAIVRPPTTLSHADKRFLTTPIAYLDSVPPDVFQIVAGSSRPEYRVYAYGYTTAGNGYARYPHNAWMTWSLGPDLGTQTGGYRTLSGVIANEKLPAPLVGGQTPVESGGGGSSYNGMRYDPTNGTVSVGDIYRFGGETKQH